MADATALIVPLRSLSISRIISSPCRRTIETVEPIASHAGISIESDVRLRERHMPLAENPEKHVERVRMSFDNLDYAPPDGESFRETAERALVCLQRRVAETPSGLLFVEHGQSLTLLLRTFNSDADFRFWLSLTLPAIIELSVDRDIKKGRFRLIEWIGIERGPALKPISN